MLSKQKMMKSYEETSILDIFPELTYYRGPRADYSTVYEKANKQFSERAARFLNGTENKEEFYDFLLQNLGTIDVNMDNYYFIKACINKPTLQTFMKYLVANGADIKALGITPLHLASYFGDRDKVRQLLTQMTINKEAKNWDGLTPLDVASEPSIIRLLKGESLEVSPFFSSQHQPASSYARVIERPKIKQAISEPKRVEEPKVVEQAKSWCTIS